MIQCKVKELPGTPYTFHFMILYSRHAQKAAGVVGLIPIIPFEFRLIFWSLAAYSKGSGKTARDVEGFLKYRIQ